MQPHFLENLAPFPTPSTRPGPPIENIISCAPRGAVVPFGPVYPQLPLRSGNHPRRRPISHCVSASAGCDASPTVPGGLVKLFYLRFFLALQTTPRQSTLSVQLQQLRDPRGFLLQFRTASASVAWAASRVGALVTSFISRSTNGRCCAPHRLSALRTDFGILN